MIKITLEKGKENFAQTLGLSEDRVNELLKKQSKAAVKILEESIKNGGFNTHTVSVELIEAASPETPEELALICYGLYNIMQDITEMGNSSLGVLYNVLFKTNE